MALRRPTLLFCIMTIVLGVNHKMSRPSPAENREVVAIFKAPALNNHLLHTFCDRSCQRNKQFKPKSSEGTSEKLLGTKRLRGRCVKNDSRWKRRWGVCFLNETEDNIGMGIVKVLKRHPEVLRGHQSVASLEGRNGRRRDTANTLTPCCPGHLPKHLDTGSTPAHQVNTTYASKVKLNMSISIRVVKRVSRSRKPKTLPYPTSRLLLNSPLPSLKCPPMQESLDTPSQHSDEVPSKPVSKSLHSKLNYFATSLHSNDTHTHPDLPTRGCDQSYGANDIPKAQFLKKTPEHPSSMNFTAVQSGISLFLSKEDAREVADGNSWDLHNKSIQKTSDNYETHLNNESTPEQERELSLFCLCFTLILFRNEELKQKVIAPLFNIYKDQSIQKLIEEFLQKLAQVGGSKQLSCPHKPDNPPANSPANDGVHPMLYTGLTLGQSPGFSSLKKDQGIHKSHTEDGRPAKTNPFMASHWLTDFTHFIPRQLTTFVSLPASFFPSAGLSSQNMAHLGCRLASLHMLPTSCDVSRTRLAQAGFYYDNSKTERNASNAHEVTCYSCGLSYSQWKKGDNPNIIHRELAPNCLHLKEDNSDMFPVSSKGTASMASSNTSSGYWSMSSGSPTSSPSTLSDQSSSLNSSQLSATTQPAPAADNRPTSETVAARDDHNQQPSMPRTDSAVASSDLATDCAGIAPGMVTTSASRLTNEPATWTARDSVTPQLSNHSSLFRSGDSIRAHLQRLDDRPPVSMNEAVYPQFTRMQLRRDTFVNWPIAHIFHPDNLVLQGFYYAGYADCIRCFYCGVGLKSWCQGDDVMDEHIRWRPSCGYLLNTRGRHFVEEVSRRLQASSSQGQSDPTNPQNQGSANTAANDATHGQTAPSGTQQSTCHPPAVSGSSGSSSGNAAAVAAAASGGGGGDGVDKETLRALEEMGFDRQAIEGAVRQLRQSGATRIDTNAVLEAILATDTDDDGSVQTDGATARNSPAGNSPAGNSPAGNGTAGNGTAGNSTAGNSTAGNADLQTDGPQSHLAAAGPEHQLAERLASENQRLKERNLCRKCKSAKVGLIFLPCGHIAACAECGKNMRVCCMCNVLIRATANVYI